MPAFNVITPQHLNRHVGTPDCPAIVDISTDPDFEADPCLVPGAFRHPHHVIPGLVTRLAGRRAVIACRKGMKLSQGLSAWLRADGHEADYLEGDMYAWRDAPGSLRVPAAAIPAPLNGATLWVTRARPRSDRIACPWLIRRFVDPAARFLFVSADEVMGVADRYGAVPFDVEGAAFTERRARCTFDALLDVFELHSEALDLLATVVRGADTGAHGLHRAAAGPMAVSVGHSRQYRDDSRRRAAGFALYDALYRWARDGVDEGHDRPSGHPA